MPASAIFVAPVSADWQKSSKQACVGQGRRTELFVSGSAGRRPAILSRVKSFPRLETLPAYVLAEVDGKKRAALARGEDVFDFGVGNPDHIEIVGYDIREEPAWNFVQEDTFASKGQKLIYHGWLKGIEGPLLRSPIVPWSYFASNFYHNVYWYPFKGRSRVLSALESKWGRMFKEYGDGTVVLPGMHPDGELNVASIREALSDFRASGDVKADIDLDQVVDLSFIRYARQVLGPYPR